MFKLPILSTCRNSCPQWFKSWAWHLILTFSNWPNSFAAENHVIWLIATEKASRPWERISYSRYDDIKWISMYKKDPVKERCWWFVQGKLSGLCGNFDMKTVNEMRTPDNIDSPTPQEFGNSWTAAEVSEHHLYHHQLCEAFKISQLSIVGLKLE